MSAALIHYRRAVRVIYDNSVLGITLKLFTNFITVSIQTIMDCSTIPNTLFSSSNLIRNIEAQKVFH